MPTFHHIDRGAVPSNEVELSKTVTSQVTKLHAGKSRLSDKKPLTRAETGFQLQSYIMAAEQ